MTWCWLALAAAVALVGPSGAVAIRVAGLRAGRRVAGVTVPPSRPARTVARWPQPARVAVAAVPCAAVAVGLGRAAGVALAGAALVLLAAAWSIGREIGRRRAEARSRAGLGVALRVLVGELAAGSGPATALRAAARASPGHQSALDQAADDAEAGADPSSALAAHPDLRAVAAAWRVGEQTGAALAGVLERVLADLAAAERTRRAVAVALSGPQSSAVVLAALPLVGIGLGATMDARPLGFLLGAPAGRLICCAGVLFDVGGVLWIRRLLRRAERG